MANPILQIPVTTRYHSDQRSPPFTACRYLLTLWGLLVTSVLVNAHPALTSAILIDINSRSIQMDVQLAADQLLTAAPELFATREHTTEQPSFATLEEAKQFLDHFDPDQTRRYLNQHIHLQVISHDGHRQTLTPDISRLMIEPVDNALHLHATLTYTAPESIHTLQLNSDAIMHRVINHRIFVSLRSDFANGVFSNQPRQLEIIRYRHNTVSLDLSNSSSWQGIRAMLTQGVQHILEGCDHLLFLLCLLLTAPLVAVNGCWQSGSSRHSWLQVLKLVSAFTVGHTLTLALGAMNIVQVPNQPVEILVALSIMVTAANVYKPLLERAMLAIASGFGLIHGLAFSSAMSGFEFDSNTMIKAMAGFAIGIEATQLLIILLVMPGLLELSHYRPRLYSWIRLAAAASAALIALLWIIERSLGNALFESWLTALPVIGLSACSLLILAALASAWLRRSATNNHTCCDS